jgi:ribosomal protein L37AE/L43A
MPERKQCIYCGDFVPHGRIELGYRTCMPCGEQQARLTRHTIVPMHKSNYMMVSDLELLRQLNPKRSA